jgi:hypothetical protein
MKNNILKLSALAVIALASSITGFAQSASVTSTATIVTPVTAVATAPLAFGTITKGATATVASTAAAAGAVTFSGDDADNLTVTIPATASISTTSGAGASMTVTISRASLRSGVTNAQGSATALDASSGTATANLSTDASGDGVNSDGLGQLYVWIGGTVAPTATQQRGNYTGTFTVSAAYSN